MRRSRLFPLVLLLALPAVTAMPHAQAAKPRDCLSSVRGLDLQRSTVLDMQRAMAAHKLTSADLVTAYLKRIKAFDHGPGELNAIRALNPHALAVTTGDVVHAASRLIGGLPPSESWPRTVL